MVNDEKSPDQTLSIDDVSTVPARHETTLPPSATPSSDVRRTSNVAPGVYRLAEFCPPCGSAKSTTLRGASARQPNWSTMICSESVPTAKSRRGPILSRISGAGREIGMTPQRLEPPGGTPRADTPAATTGGALYHCARRDGEE